MRRNIMLPRENQSYDRHLVTKENQLFEFQCGHIVTTSITTMIDFNNSDELGRWNTNNAKGNCPRCGQIEGFKLLQEKIITEKNDCYDEMEWYHQILVDHSLNIIFYRTYELCKSIDNKEYPRIHKEVVELLETIKKYENELENMDSTFEFYRNNYAMNQSFNIMNEHVSRAGLYLTNLHFKLTDILRSIYENPSQFSD